MKKRILFVDDDQSILEGLRTLLRRHRREMDLVFALDGEAAIKELDKAPIDVIVSDLRMPNMDGATLLTMVKAQYPGIVRIVLSGDSDRDAILRVLPVAHQFLAKPCEVDRLHNVLTRVCQLQDLLANKSIRKALGRIEKLPSLPTAYWDLIHALSNPDLSVPEIAQIVENDSAMCVKILQLANSCCFGTIKSISSISHAVSYLGIDLIRHLALIANVFQAMEQAPVCPGFSFAAVQTHALLTARVVKNLLPDTPSQDASMAAGLLHDIGYLVLASCDRDRFRAVIEGTAKTGRPTCEIESEVFGLTHADDGAYLLNMWGLSFPLIEAVAYHHDPKAAGAQKFDLPSALSVADILVHQALEGGDGLAMPSALTQHLAELGVLSELPRWRELARREVEEWQGVHNSEPSRQC